MDDVVSPSPPVRPRVPRRRPTPEQATIKKKLVESFSNFSSSAVSDVHLANAWECIRNGGGTNIRYQCVPFKDILANNEGKEDHLTMMTSAYDLLLKYVINLLKPKRPQVWRSIKTNNTAFKARVNCMEGSRDILKAVGYSEVSETSMQFPEDVLGPDLGKLCTFAAELLMAKLEVELMNQQPTPAQQQQQQQITGQQPVAPHGYSSGGMFPMVARTEPFHLPSPQVDNRSWQNGHLQQQHLTQEQDTLQQSTHILGPPPQPRPSPRTPGSGDTATAQPNSPQPSSLDSHGSSGSSSVSGSPHSSLSDSTAHASTGTENRGEVKRHLNFLDTLKKQREQRQQQQQHRTAPMPVMTSRTSDVPPTFGYTTPKKILSKSEMHDDDSGSRKKGASRDLPNGSIAPPLPPKGHYPQSKDSSGTILYPPKKDYPKFHNDVIEEEDESVSNKVSGVIPSSTSSLGGYCERCKCKISSHDDRCPYCRSPVSARGHIPQSQPHEMPPKVPPISKPPSPIVRASPQAAQEAEKQHRQTQLFNLQPQHDPFLPTEFQHKKQAQPLDPYPGNQQAQPLDPYPGNQQAQPLDPYPGNQQAQPLDPYPGNQQAQPLDPYLRNQQGQPLDPYPRNQQGQPLDPYPRNQQGQPLDPYPRNQQAQPLDPYPRNQQGQPLDPYPRNQQAQPLDPYLGNQQGQPLDPYPRNQQDAYPQNKPDHPTTSAEVQASGTGEATGSSECLTATGQTWSEYMRDKEEARKKFLQKQKEEGMADRRRHEEGRPGSGGKWKQDAARRFERESIIPADFCKRKKLKVEEEEWRSRMEKLEKDGSNFLKSVKTCHRLGYSLDEVQIAMERAGEKRIAPLDYLETEWVRTIRNVQSWVPQFAQDTGESVGFPHDLEARKFLMEADGNIHTAVNNCHEFRKAKVQELLQKYGKKIPDLSWSAAVTALSANDMDITTAFCAIQCEMLNPLYEYIFSEWKNVKQADMEEIKRLIQRDDLEEEVRQRLLMAECRLETTEKAKMVLDLMKEVEVGDQKYPLHYYTDAAENYDTLEAAMAGLLKPCNICTLEYPIHEMVAMPSCIHSVCKECFKMNFTITIKGRPVKHFTCPECGEPDLANRDEAQDLYLEIFVGLIKEHCDREVYQLCQEKLAEFGLLKDPNFRWCANDKCRFGFLNERDPRVKKIQCTSCSEFMCFQCKKPWEPQHDDLTCEAFALWKQDNDPAAQEEGLAAHLKSNGIECPACQMRYDLARGGCMHFKCTQCPNEFCSGCGQSFKNGKACGKLESCAKKGLHAHHPRDCLFYLRDFDVPELQAFLRDNKIPFDTEKPAKKVEKGGEKKAEEEKPEEEGPDGQEAAVAPLEGEQEVPAAEEVEKCIVMLQKELADGLVDERCGEDVVEGHAGICVTHYKEYLVTKINLTKLDPITLYETNKVQVMLMREEKEVPQKEDDEMDDDYRERLIKHVQETLPMQRK